MSDDVFNWVWGVLADDDTREIGNESVEKIAARIRTLEAELAEARKYAAPENASALSWVKNPCTQHNQYWTTASGACMACRAEKAETELAQAKADVLRYEQRATQIMEKCEQYWNQSGISDAEIHAALDYIHSTARGALSRAGGK